MTIQILIVDDEQPIRESLSGLFEDEGYLVSTAASGEEAVARFRKSPADCVFLDIWMPGIDGIETMSRIKQISPDVPIIIMSGHATIDTAVRATKQGAFDFIEKPFSLDKLLILLRNAVDKRRLEFENSNLKFENKQECPRLIGDSQAIQQVLGQIAKVQLRDMVLLTGEHGTGKSIVAQMLHQDSDRHQAPFITFQSASVGEHGVEAEFFGYEKGAFAGAMQAHRGRLEAAHTGTLYIEEIADVPLHIQDKLLSVIQEHRLQRLGNPSQVACDVRIILGSQRTKDTLFQEDAISQSFFKQLNVVHIHMPTLKERSDDIAPLLASFANKQAKLLGGEPVKFSEDAIEEMQQYDWPGNVRELRNYVERSQMLFSGQTITLRTMLPLDGTITPPEHEPIFDDTVLEEGFHDAKKRFESSYILHHLEKHGWNISRTAADIGMERSQLHRKIRTHNLEQCKPEKPS